jgi:hypothetical protein
MSPVQQIGPLFYVNGPLPRPPRRNFVQAVDEPEVEDGHAFNGIEVYGYIPDTGSIWGTCGQVSSPPDVKLEQGTPNPLPQFGPVTLYLAETCQMRSIMLAAGEGPTNEAFKARAAVTFAAIESAAIAHEFWTGEAIGNPALADANATVLTSGPTSPIRGIALLERAIADTGRAGMIHLSPELAWTLTAVGSRDIFEVARDGKLYTVNGTQLVIDAGYDGTAPEGESPSSGSIEWAYATGPVELIRDAPIIVPGEVREALDRDTNTITYRAERYAIPFWDTALQAAVEIDLCQSTCAAS